MILRLFLPMLLCICLVFSGCSVGWTANDTIIALDAASVAVGAAAGAVGTASPAWGTYLTASATELSRAAGYLQGGTITAAQVAEIVAAFATQAAPAIPPGLPAWATALLVAVPPAIDAFLKTLPSVTVQPTPTVGGAVAANARSAPDAVKAKTYNVKLSVAQRDKLARAQGLLKPFIRKQ